MRVALITNIPAPYRFPVWSVVAKNLEEMHVYFCAERESNRIWQIENMDNIPYEYYYLPGKSWHIAARDWGIHWNPTLWGELRRYRPTHIVVTGYETPTYLIAIAYAKVHRLPLVIWWGSHALSSRSRKGVVAQIRRRVLRAADAFVTYGSMATDYLADMGVPKSRIITGVNTVDVERVAKLVEANQLNKRLRRDRSTHFLYVGQLVERKGVQQLLSAFRALPQGEAKLTIVGYGPLEERLKAFVETHGMHNVKFAGGTRTLEETAQYYAWADVLVMPSIVEVWGLVINEALAAGLWVLASVYAGSTPDLVTSAPVDVGQVFDPIDNHDFVNTLSTAIKLAKKRDASAIKAWALEHTPEKYADSVIRALSAANTR